MAYTVSVSTSYRRGCRACIEEAERIAVQGIRDASVTSITLRVSNSCDHGDAPSPTLPNPHNNPDQPTLPNLQLDSPSDTNGYDWSAAL